MSEATAPFVCVAPVAEAVPELPLLVRVAVPEDVAPLFVVAAPLDDEEVPVAVPDAADADTVASAAKRSDDWYVTQLDDAGMGAVNGIVVIGPSDSGGCVYVVATPSVVYTPTKYWLSESHISKTPFCAAFGHT